MHQDDLGDSLSFVDETRNEPLWHRPGGKKQPSRWMPLLGVTSLLLGALVLSIYLGVIHVPALEKLTKDDRQPGLIAGGPVPKVPAMPPAPPTPAPSTRARPERSPQVIPRKGGQPVQLAPEPPLAPESQNPAEKTRPGSLAKSRGNPSGEEDGQMIQDRRTSRELLEEKGLKLVGNRFILAGKEAAAAIIFNRDLSKFDELHRLFPAVNQIDNILNMIRIAENMRQGTIYDNNDLNIEMDTVPTRGGAREQYMNSIQRDMHNQLLNNRQSIANLDRMIGTLRSELRNYPPRDRLIAQFQSLASTCQQSLNEIDNAMTEIVEEYARLNDDRTVTDALAELDRRARTSNTIAPSDDFRDALNKLNKEKKFVAPQSPPRRTNRRR